MLNRAGFLSSVAPVLFSGVLAAFSASPAIAGEYECMTDAPGVETCLVIPDDAPATITLQSEAPGKANKTPSMLTERELEGQALDLENEFAFNNGLDATTSEELRESKSNREAMIAGTRVQNQLRQIDIFKSGPLASSPDSGVISTSKRK